MAKRNEWKLSKIVTGVALFVGALMGIIICKIDGLAGKHPLIAFGGFCLGFTLAYLFNKLLVKAIERDLKEE